MSYPALKTVLRENYTNDEIVNAITRAKPLNKMSLRHKEFWGRDMGLEEVVWKSENATMLTEHMANVEDTVDEGEASEGEESVGRFVDYREGCFPIRFGKGLLIPDSEIWVRADYLLLYDRIEEHYNRMTELSHTGAVILTGQPGCGKSVFQFYAARRFCAERKPFIWFDEQLFLFLEDGVYEIPNNYPRDGFKFRIRTLVDSDNASSIPEHLIDRGTDHFVIFSTSPNEQRWSRLSKTLHYPLVLYINPWTRWEIHQAAPLILKQPDISLIDRAYDEYGPTPRICLMETSTPERYRKYTSAVDHAVGALTLPKLEQLTTANVMTISEGSHKLFLIRRTRAAETDSLAFVSVITDTITMKMAASFRQLKRADKVRVYHIAVANPGSRALGGTIYEPFCQEQFKTRIQLEYLPMVRLPDAAGSKTKHQWHTSHTMLQAKLEELRRLALARKGNLFVEPNAVVEYTEDYLRTQTIQDGTFYIPKAKNQVALDSFIIHDGILYLFQFTVGTHHTIKDGLISFIQGGTQGFPSWENVRLISIIPGEVVMKTPFAHSDELAKISLYSSVFAVED